MYIWFRFIGMLVALRWKKHCAIFDTTQLRVLALPNDLDFNLHVNNGRVNTLADLGRVDYFLRSGLWRYATSVGARPMVGDICTRFRKEMKAFHWYTLHTRLLGWEGKWAFLEHRFERKGRVVAWVVMRGVFKGPQGTLLPQDLLKASGHAEPTQSSPPLPEWVRHWHHALESMSLQIRHEEAQAGFRHTL